MFYTMLEWLNRWMFGVSVAHFPEAAKRGDIRALQATLAGLSIEDKIIFFESKHDGQTALMWATEVNRETVQVLLDNLEGFDYESKQRALAGGLPRLVHPSFPETLEDGKAWLNVIEDFTPTQKMEILNQPGAGGYTALMVAACYDKIEFTKVLLTHLKACSLQQKLAILAYVNADGVNALMMASFSNHPVVMGLLLDSIKGCTSEQKCKLFRQADENGRTILMAESRKAFKDNLIECLLETLTDDDRQVLFNLENNKGQTALEMAYRSDCPDTVAVLESFGATLGIGGCFEKPIVISKQRTVSCDDEVGSSMEVTGSIPQCPF